MSARRDAVAPSVSYLGYALNGDVNPLNASSVWWTVKPYVYRLPAVPALVQSDGEHTAGVYDAASVKASLYVRRQAD